MICIYSGHLSWYTASSDFLLQKVGKRHTPATNNQHKDEDFLWIFILSCTLYYSYLKLTFFAVLLHPNLSVFISTKDTEGKWETYDEKVVYKGINSIVLDAVVILNDMNLTYV